MLTAAGASDRGLVRPNNEDAVLCDPEQGLFAVVDGMGGHRAGEVASAIVVRELKARLAPDGRPDTGMEEALRDALRDANDAVLEQADAHPEWQGMGAAAVVAVCAQGVLHIANLGDSRAYLVRGNRPEQLSRDHTVAATLFAQEQFTAEEARSHPLRNRLTAVVGARRPVQPAYRALALRPDDRILLCSDGLWEPVTDTEIAAICRGATPADCARELIRLANDRGGRDNVTVIVIAVSLPGEECHV